MKPKIMAMLASAALAVSACGGDATTPPPYAADWQQTVDDLRALQSTQEVPDHLLEGDAARDGSEFDAAAYFEVLQHIEPEPGFALDYVYVLSPDRGFPRLYVRRADQPGYATLEEFSYLTGELAVQGDTAYLDQIYVIDGTPDGFFEYVVLEVMGGQFYLHWHAMEDSAVVVATRAALDEELDAVASMMDEAELDKARAVDPSPQVSFEEETAVVEVYVFTRWGGLSRRTYTIEKIFPQQILDVDVETVAECECGIPF